MNTLTKTTLKTFFYNLIFFDFIFLNPFNKKVSNFYLQKTLFLKNKYFFRLSVFELLKSFKLFIRLFYFLSKQSNTNKFNKKLLLYIWCANLQDIQFLKFFLNKYKMGILFEISHLFPNINKKFNFFKNVLVLDQQLKNNDYKNFFFRNLYLIQRVDIFEDFKSWGSYKIHNNLNDIKKLILFGLILVQIFKK
jgi:hypothetical protein